MEDEIKNKLLEWVVKKAADPKITGIEYDTNIIEGRIINSIHIMDLILYMEYLLGHPVKIDRIKSGAFSTVNSIYETFFCEQAQNE